jgi:hypothetical protein
MFIGYNKVMSTNRHTPNPLIKLEKSVRAALLQEHFFEPEQAFKVLGNTLSEIIKHHLKEPLFDQPGFLFSLAKKTSLKAKAFANEEKTDDEIRKMISNDSAYSAAHQAVRKLDIFQTPFGHFKIDTQNYTNNESKAHHSLQALCVTQAVNNIMRSLIDNATISESRLRNLFEVHLSMKLLVADTNTGIYNDDKADKHPLFSENVKNTITKKLDAAIETEKSIAKAIEQIFLK